MARECQVRVKPGWGMLLRQVHASCTSHSNLAHLSVTVPVQHRCVLLPSTTPPTFSAHRVELLICAWCPAWCGYYGCAACFVDKFFALCDTKRTVSPHHHHTTTTPQTTEKSLRLVNVEGNEFSKSGLLQYFSYLFYFISKTNQVNKHFYDPVKTLVCDHNNRINKERGKKIPTKNSLKS